MAQFSYEELKKKTVAQLREIAHNLGEEAVKGHSQMNKEHLLKTLCQAMHVDTHQHHQVVGLNKTTIKSRIRQYRERRDEARQNGDQHAMHIYMHYIHQLKRKIHKSTV